MSRESEQYGRGCDIQRAMEIVISSIVPYTAETMKLKEIKFD